MLPALLANHQNHHHQCSAQGQFLHCKHRDLGCHSAEGRSSTTNSGTKADYLFSIWTDLKRSEKIPGAPTWRWREWIWLTRPSGLHQNSPQGLNISSIWVSTITYIRKSQSPFTPKSPKNQYIYILVVCVWISPHCRC